MSCAGIQDFLRRILFDKEGIAYILVNIDWNFPLFGQQGY